MEQVDVLLPPTFKKSGVVKIRKQALADRDWIGAFNLWIVQNDPVPAIVYQQRSPNSTWEPSKLDVSAGGQYSAGEEMEDGLREAKEELGKIYTKSDLTYLGKRLNVSPDSRGLIRYNVIDIFITTDNSPIESYELEKNEVSAITVCPLDKLINLHFNNEPFNVTAFNNDKEKFELPVTRTSFPINWDNYHLKMALISKRYLGGETNLIY